MSSPFEKLDFIIEKIEDIIRVQLPKLKQTISTIKN